MGLESELSVAETDLTVEEESGFYRPCRSGEETLVPRGRVYLHNRSGARKSSGTYFTKSFAVDHLLDYALEPALKEHFERLQSMDEDTAFSKIFDFRVADIAMGSGHFLVAAIDRIERAFADHLARGPLSGVLLELAKLRSEAQNALGSLAPHYEINDDGLLRRLIARRCIYGVDRNPVAVELARLSIWIHTFVPGLPLSLLDHNLVLGDSLVGIGTMAEIEDFARVDEGMYSFEPRTFIGMATGPLERLGLVSDASATELGLARWALGEAQRAVAPAEALCDIVTACRIEEKELTVNLQRWEEVKEGIIESKAHKDAKRALDRLRPFHFPIAFPEVFLRERSGFDVILGNPPWEEATLEEHAFWARHVPGLRGLSQREQERTKERLRRERPDLVALYEAELAEAEATRLALTKGPYPGMGTGDPDLYKAFCWRFWNLVCAGGGWIGVVLPRSAFNAKGSTEFRLALLEGAEIVDLVSLLNTGGWAFDEAEPRYTINLAVIRRRASAEAEVRLRGPFSSLVRFTEGRSQAPSIFRGDEVRGWTDTASLPLLPTEQSLEVFEQIRKAPRLDLNDGKSWRARPATELHATNDKGLMDLDSSQCPDGFWPVFKGESFDLWTPDTGSYYAWADPEDLIAQLQKRRERGVKNQRSPFFELDPGWARKRETLPCLQPRICFRDVARATDSRTVRVAIIPPKVFLTNKAPYFLWPRGTQVDQAFLLGVLSSLTLDWYARRFVEVSLNFYILNPFPIPRPARESMLARRVVGLAGRLGAPDERFASWAKTVGVECGPLATDEKNYYIHELDAVVAHLYGLSETQLTHVFETFHEGWDYETSLKATREHFRAWRKKLK